MHTDFHKAYEAADQAPGTPISFEGALPSGFFTQQVIIRVPSGQNPLKLAHELSNGDFKGARSVLTSSSQQKGTHIVATYGELKAPARTAQPA